MIWNPNDFSKLHNYNISKQNLIMFQNPRNFLKLDNYSKMKSYDDLKNNYFTLKNHSDSESLTNFCIRKNM